MIPLNPCFTTDHSRSFLSGDQPSSSQRSGAMCAWLRILRSVPTATSRLFGTMTVSTRSPDCRRNLTWLPFWLASANPAASSRRLISRKGSGLSRPNLNLNRSKLRGTRGSRRLEMKLQRLLQIRKSFFFALTLAGNIDFKALRDEPISLAPDGSSERSFHSHILSQHPR